MLQDDWSPSIIYKYPKQHNVTLPATEHLAGFAAFLAGPQADCSNTAPCDKSKKESTSKSDECCHLPFAWMPFPLPFSEKLVVWIWNDSQQHKLASSQASWTRASRNATFLATGNADFWRSNESNELKTKKQNKVQEVKIEVSRMLRFKNQTVVPVVNQRDLNYGSAKIRWILSAEKVTKKLLLGIGTSDFRGIAWTACTACPTGFGSWWMWITHDISNKQPRLFTYSLLKGWIMNSRKSAAKDDTKSCLCPSSLAPQTVGPPFVAPLAQCAAWTPLDVNHTGSALVRFWLGSVSVV